MGKKDRNHRMEVKCPQCGIIIQTRNMRPKCFKCGTLIRATARNGQLIIAKRRA